MKKILAALSALLMLISCAKETVEPVGIYTLSSHGLMYILTIKAEGQFTLKISQPQSQVNEIRGTWEKEDANSQSISLHGIIWKGLEPTQGNGFWKIFFEGSGGEKICMDGESIICFLKQHQ